jgi:Tfp pilus assembly protein PilF/GTP-binding protein EngB required for normal cell division
MGILDRLGQRLNELVDDLTAPDEVREQLAAGSAALHAGDLVEAEALLRRVVGAAPGASRPWHLLGLSLLRQGKLPEALSSLERANATRPDDFAVLLALAEAQRRAGRSGAALQTYKQALTCRVDEHLLDQVFGGLGELYLERGDLDHAVRELRKAVASSGGQDLRLLGLLGQAQFRAGTLDLARQTLERAATAVPADRVVLLLLCDLALHRGHLEEARLAALRLRQEHPGDIEARCALARTHLAAGRLEEAQRELLEALMLDAQELTTHQLLGEVYGRVRDLDAALRHLRTALQLAPPLGGEAIELLRQILTLELAATPTPQLHADAATLLALRPEDPLALAASAIAAPAEPQAEELLRRSLAARETSAGRLGLGLWHLSRGAADAAAIELRAALRLEPDQAYARLLLSRAFDALAGGPPLAAAEIYPTLRRTHSLFLSHAALSDLGAEAARIREVFDRPLLVTVMGEFNSGKSTFVNALIGESVAPMGVTPTTATINVLKYGERRAARVLWRDDREQLLEWHEVGAFLGSLQRAQASAIRMVELLYPAEELLRVNVVDTPGLNSMIDEHEQTARDYMAQSDAVIWLFSAHQAGKQTEQQALELIHQHRLKTVGVINKIDRLEPAELQQVTEHLRRSFAGLIDLFIPVSARHALEALAAGEEAALEASRFPALRRLIEEQLFAQSRAIKREACARRLDAVLRLAERRAGDALAQTDAALRRLDDAQRELEHELATDVVARERLALRAALQEVARQGAEEVLDFVRPRRWALGEHHASRADRDFLLDLLQDALRRMGEASLDRVGGQLRRAADGAQQALLAALRDAPTLQGALHPEAMVALVGERLSLLQQQVYIRYSAYARGYMRGGRLDHFFDRQLPRIELSVEPVSQALAEGSVDLEEELLVPLGRWYGTAADALRRQLPTAREAILLHRLELETRLVAPILALQRAVATVAPGAG